MGRKKKVDPDADNTIVDDRDAGQLRLGLRRKVKMFYDLQAMRLNAAGRTYKRPTGVQIILHALDKRIIERRAEELKSAEKAGLGDIKDHLKVMPFYVKVLSDPVRYRGVGPTMAGVIMSSFDIFREDTPSKMWAFAGLKPVPANRCSECHDVMPESGSHQKPAPYRKRPGEDEEVEKTPQKMCSQVGRDVSTVPIYASGRSQRPEAGKKLPYNAWLRTKLVGVLGPVILQCATYHCNICKERVTKKKEADGLHVVGPDEVPLDEATPQLEGQQFVHSKTEGMTCSRLGDALSTADVTRVDSPWRRFYDEYKHRKATAGWGRSDKHRHQAAVRYMIKMLLQDIWREWRAFEGLPVRPSYAEEFQHKAPHSGGQASPPVLAPIMPTMDEAIAAELELV